MSADEKTLYEIEAREKMLHDEASARLYERNLGIKQGTELVIEKLKKKGFTNDLNF